MANLFNSPAKSAGNLLWFPFFLFLYSFTGNVSNDIYMPSMPVLVNIFNTNDHLIQMTLAMWFLGDAAPQLLMGPIADRYGRRALLFTGGMTFLLATFICAISSHIGYLIIARFFQGVGVCSLTIVGFVVIHELFQGHQCVRLLSFLTVFNSAAPLLGPLIGGYVFLLLGWRANFVIVLVLGLVGILGLWKLMPESKTNLDYTALQPKVLLNNYISLFKNRLFMCHLIAYGLFFGGIIAYLSGAPFVIIKQLGIPAQYFGLTQLFIFGAFILTSLLVGKFVKRYSNRSIILTGSILIVFAAVLMLIMSLCFPQNLYGFVGAMMLYAAGFGLAGSPLAKETLSASPHWGGFSAAMLGFSMTGFSSLGSFVVSVVYNQTIFSVAVVILVMTVVALLVCSLAGNKVKIRTEL
ncbi:MAG: multidrug effflux MFS transporter [Legionellales bacterium]|nr:multidrug effflux MFS transporter [Legionellales bacterium]